MSESDISGAYLKGHDKEGLLKLLDEFELECELRFSISYCPSSGTFTWLRSRFSTKIGREAGSVSKDKTRRLGYIVVGFKKRKYYGHRLAWFFYYGFWPKGEIDHISQNSLDNRIVNLRCVNSQQNSRNSSKRCHNTSGYPGVFLDKRCGRYQAQLSLRVDGKRFGKSLGYYNTPEEAFEAYKNGCIKYGFHENHYIQTNHGRG